jgi:hypothetical protein
LSTAGVSLGAVDEGINEGVGAPAVAVAVAAGVAGTAAGGGMSPTDWAPGGGAVAKTLPLGLGFCQTKR